MTNSSQGFRRDARGNVAIIVALTLMVLVTIVLGTLDYARAYSVRYSLQAALDAAALAAAKETIDSSASVATTESRLAAVAQSVLVANLNINSAAATVTPVQVKYTPPVGFTVPDKIELSASASVNTTFLKTLGLKPVTVVASSATQPPQGAPVELALALDVTGSMSASPSGGGESKLATLKTAARSLVSQVMSGGNPNVKVGIVPYTSYVNVGVQNPIPDWMITMDKDLGSCAKWSDWQYPNGLCKPPVYYDCKIDGVMVTNGCSSQDCSNKGTRTCIEPVVVRLSGNTGCVGPRGAYNNNPALMGANKTTDIYLDNLRDINIVKFPTAAAACNPAQVLDLTTSRTAVQTAINNLTASGETHIPNGLTWAWNLLAPGAPYDNAKSLSQLKSIGGRKVIVLMTDGANSTTPRFYDASYPPNGYGGNPGPWQSGTLAVDLIRKLCNNIKADGIEIYTVLFDVQGGDTFTTDTRTNVTNCAGTEPGKSDPRMAFSASDRDSLLKAFADIGNQLRLLKITN